MDDSFENEINNFVVFEAIINAGDETEEVARGEEESKGDTTPITKKK